MKLEGILDLTEGVLQNSPKISSFRHISTNPHSIKRGDLYICTTEDPGDIEIALQNRTYGVIHALENIERSDEESAYIKVDSINSTILRLLRYALINRHIRFYYGSNIVCNLISVLANKSSPVLPHSYADVFEILINSKEHQNYISNDRKLLESIALDYEELTPKDELVFNIISKTMFHTTIFFEGIIYDALPIPPIFLKELSLVLDFMEQKCIFFDLYKFEFIPHFKPHFTNKKLEPKKFGQSDMVIIVESDLDEYEKYLAYIKKNAKWGRSIFIMPVSMRETFETFHNIYFYDRLKDIEEILQANVFNFALIYGIDEENLATIINEKRAKQGRFTI